MRLVEAIDYDRERDMLWFVGDLVNRGPKSLEVLRWIREQGDQAQVVLGNHDVHLLATACGLRDSHQDSLEAILAAPDRDQLIDWLRRCPLLHREDPWLLVHAGIHPAWTPAQAARFAREIEAMLRADNWRDNLRRLVATTAPTWSPELPEAQRAQAALAVLVRARTMQSDGTLVNATGPPNQAPQGCQPWFDLRNNTEAEPCFVFGHWSSLGLRIRPSYIALDTGCVWGRSLSAIRLDDRRLFQVASAEGATKPT